MTMTKLTLTFREDDLTGAEIRALVAHHLKGMADNSPPGTCFAFDVDQLKQPGVTLWSAWDGEALAGMGGLKAIDRDNGELKSMRVADRYLGKGAGRALLEHLMAEARRRKISVLWLETGSSDGFAAALKLYENAGFRYCGPFFDYADNGFSRFMTREI
jgi:putative acetyltransferase